MEVANAGDAGVVPQIQMPIEPEAHVANPQPVAPVAPAPIIAPVESAWDNAVLKEGGEWHGLTMNIVLKALKIPSVAWTKITRKKSGGEERTEQHMVASYKQWNSMTNAQKDKTFSFWGHLDAEKKTFVLDQVKAQMASATAGEQAGAASTTANEYARLLCVINMSVTKGALANLRGGLDRQAIDSLRSHEAEVAQAANAWNSVAEIFNDPESNPSCNNSACKYNLADEKTAVMVSALYFLFLGQNNSHTHF